MKKKRRNYKAELLKFAKQIYEDTKCSTANSGMSGGNCMQEGYKLCPHCKAWSLLYGKDKIK